MIYTKKYILINQRKYRNTQQSNNYFGNDTNNQNNNIKETSILSLGQKIKLK